MYLTWVLDTTGASGGSLRHRLRLLDLAAVHAGRPAPSRDRHLRTYLRGLHKEAPLGPVRARTPLYLEDLHAVLDAIDGDRLQQSRDTALLLLANNIGLPAEVLRRLRWHDLRLRRDRVEVRVPAGSRAAAAGGTLVVPATGGPACTVAALRELRRQAGPVPGAVFSRRGGPPPGTARVSEVLALLLGRARAWTPTLPVATEKDLAPALARLGRPRPRQARDKALLLLAFTACLMTTKAAGLRVGDIARRPRGLLLTLPGRAPSVAVPRSGHGRHCPVACWEDWAARLAENGLARPSDPAFPRIVDGAVLPGRIGTSDLNKVVDTRCDRAGLDGEHGFTALRSGFMRTALRADVPEHLVLRQAGMRTLAGLKRHSDRQDLLDRSAAGMVGL